MNQSLMTFRIESEPAVFSLELRGLPAQRSKRVDAALDDFLLKCSRVCDVFARHELDNLLAAIKDQKSC